jgi:membrane protease YdiL (CAAX protease family)
MRGDIKMKKLQENKPIWHAVIFILIYIVLVNIGDNLPAILGVEDLATVIILIAFSLILLIYLKKNNWFKFYGFNKIKKSDLTKALFFIPLIITIPLHYFRGINQELGTTGFILAGLLMVCVGFLEELLFRGFLYQAILKERGIIRAVFISGVTFGIGHVVNLARGYSAGHQIIQIVVGIFIGILLALIVALTNNIVPCVLWHIFFNFSGTITNSNLKMETYMVLIVAIICTLYFAYLIKAFKLKGDYKNNLPIS